MTNNTKIKLPSNRSFGIVFFIVFFLVSLYPLINDKDIRVWSFILSLLFLLLGIKNSNILTPFNIMWLKFGLLLGKIVSPIIICDSRYLPGLLAKSFELIKPAIAAISSNLSPDNDSVKNNFGCNRFPDQ